MWRNSESGFLDGIEASPWERDAFSTYDRQLLATAEHTNLVARSSLDHRWERHYGDSAQLWPIIPESALNLLDFGSGAGFPGMVLAILSQDRRPGFKVTLCDSVGKKANFLAGVAQAVGLTDTRVIAGRVENLPATQRFDVITARAVTALPGLIEYAASRLNSGGVMIFPKGQRAELELDQAQKQWSFEVESKSSETDPEARILMLRSPERIG